MVQAESIAEGFVKEKQRERENGKQLDLFKNTDSQAFSKHFDLVGSGSGLRI